VFASEYLKVSPSGLVASSVAPLVSVNSLVVGAVALGDAFGAFALRVVLTTWLALASAIALRLGDVSIKIARE
jgi:hypothetical protein